MSKNDPLEEGGQYSRALKLIKIEEDNKRLQLSYWKLLSLSVF